MNIANVGDAQLAARVGATQSEVKRGNNEPAALPDASQQPENMQRNDEYVPSPKNRINNALYAVSNVNSKGIAQYSNNVQPGRVTPSGETIGPKVVEILLPTGRKSLTIYRKQ